MERHAGQNPVSLPQRRQTELSKKSMLSQAHLKGRIGDSPRLVPRGVVRSFSESRAAAARLSKLGRSCASRSLPPVLLRVAPVGIGLHCATDSPRSPGAGAIH